MGLAGLLGYAGAAIRTHVLLGVTVLTVSVLVGGGTYLAVEPTWRVRSEVRVGGLIDDGSGQSGSGSITVSAGDVALLMASDALQNEIRELPPSEDRDVKEGGRAVKAGRDLVRDVISGVRRAVGFDSAVEERDRLEVSVAEVTQSVVTLEVRAGNPDLAEHAPGRLVEAVRDRLTQAERSRALARLEEMKPVLLSAEAEMKEATGKVSASRAATGLQDPQAYARQLQEELGRATAERLEVETQIREADQERAALVSQLMQMERETFGGEVVADNPRIRELQREISDLKSQYDAMGEFTDKYPKKLSIKNQVAAKERELEQERQTVVRERTTTPNPVYEDRRRAQLGLDQRIDGLSGRLEGLANTLEQLGAELDSAAATSALLAELERAERVARERYDGLNSERRRLETVAGSGGLFANLSLLKEPVVANRSRPDSPSLVQYGVLTALIGVGLAVSVCVLAAWRSGMLICDRQMRVLASRAGVEVVASLPGRSIRRLLTSGGGGA